MIKKRICIFSLMYSPFIGGAEIAIKEITDRIDDIEFDLITLKLDKKLPKFEKIGNVNIYRIGFSLQNPKMSDFVKFPLHLNKFIYPFLAFLKASALHKKNNYDGIWAMMAAYAGFGALFFKIFNPKVDYFLSLQEGDPIELIMKKTRIVKPLFKKIFTKADKIQVLSSFLAGWAKQMGYKGNVEIIPNGVDIKYFSQSYSDEILDNLKKELGKKEDEKFIVTTSRLVAKNACDDVIRSLGFLPNNIKFLILGDGPDMNNLKKLTQGLFLKERVIFLGSVDQSLIPKYLKISDIFCRPSLSEGLGNSFVEAMAVGLPVIATQEGGIADFLFDEKRNLNKKSTGWAVDVRSPEQIAGAVKDILANPEKTGKILETAKKMVIEKYDWDIIAKDMQEKVFGKLLN